jgi:hypothetical protein
MRPTGKFKYALNVKKGYFIFFIDNVQSTVEIHVNDELNYRGNKLVVVSKDGDNLTVKRIGCLITVV